MSTIYSLLLLLSATAPLPDDGNALLVGCKAALLVGEDSTAHPSEGLVFAAGHCLGLIKGITYLGVGGRLWNAPVKVCLPDNVGLKEANQSVVKYLENHPERRDKKDAILVIEALNDTYPCKAPS